jgi:hypothetical protein
VPDPCAPDLVLAGRQAPVPSLVACFDGAVVGSSGGNLATCRGLNQLERVMFYPALLS